MFFVEAKYHTEPRRVGAQVKYIAHRQPGLDEGAPRKLWGIGARYRHLRGDEAAIGRQLREDGRDLRRPVYFRFIVTVDDPTAARLKRLDDLQIERILRDAIERTFRGVARGTQGVFAVHRHGGENRPAHPHAHVLLSPRFENGMAVHLSPVRIQRIRGRWERELLWVLDRHERRVERPREAMTRADQVRVQRDVPRREIPLLPPRRHPERAGVTAFTSPRRALRSLRTNPWTRVWLGLNRRRRPWHQDPERAAQRFVWRLASRAIPRSLREVLARIHQVDRGISRLR